LEHSGLIEQGILKRDGKLSITWEELGQQFGMDGEAARQVVKHYCKRNGLLKGKFENGKDRILIISDLHVPDHQEEMILDIIRRHKDVSMIILAGDILDCHAVSAWMNEEMTILDHEMITAHDLLMKIRAITKAKMVLVKGNHEQRVNAHYAKNAKSMGTAVVETEVLYKLANGFEIKLHEGGTGKKKVTKRVKYEAIEDVEYADARTYIYGDLLVNHPSIFSKDHMKTVARMWTEKLKNKYPHVKVVAIGHTHQLGMVHHEDGRVLIETGCTCFPASYADQDDRPFKLQQYGYVYLEMKNLEVDIDSIKVKHLGHDNLETNYDNLDDF
jgi:predicted phosphodiesterase